jgi:hypothetical protein
MAAPMPAVDPPAAHDTADPDATTDHRAPCPCCGGRMIIVEVVAPAAHLAAHRPPAPGSGFDAMTILVVPLQHRFAGTSRSRRCAGFIPAPASAGTASQTSPQSGRRVRQQRPVRNHQPLSALSDLRKTIPHQNPPNPHRRPSAHRFPARSFFGGFPTPAPDAGSIARAGPASETLHATGQSRRPRSGCMNPTR